MLTKRYDLKRAFDLYDCRSIELKFWNGYKKMKKIYYFLNSNLFKTFNHLTKMRGSLETRPST
jgi:hypothetical protein